jgi:DNA-binding MarR family transcriptional regulator
MPQEKATSTMHAFFKIPESLARDKTLKSTAKLVLARLARHANPETGRCDPRVTTLADELGRHRNTIQRAIGRLRKLGLIETHKGQRGLSFAILLHQNGSARCTKMGQQSGFILYELEQVNRAAPRSPKPQHDVPRKPPCSQVLEFYYAEQRRKAAR